MKILPIGLTFALASTMASADFFDHGRPYGFNIVVNYSGLSAYYSGVFGQARAMWNGISSKVSIYKSSALSTANDSYQVVTQATSNPSVFGYTPCYGKNFASTYYMADPNEDWYKCTVILYGGNMNTYNSSNTQRIQVAAHEIGHSLKFAHNTIVANFQSIMKADTVYDSPTPTNSDYAELKAHWGL